ncbi:MAG: hypothetical protein MUF42_07150 [Cytophagaceae bacterium]|jgi:hypothetical protein|nr:hypothetical protein [Cytophagaceae bacterium]
MTEYVSPFSILPGLKPGETLDASQWILLKKKILAEFQLNDEKPIQLGKQIYSKDQILRLIDDLKNSEDFQHHSLIWNTPGLLDFLQSKQLPKNPTSWSTLKDNNAFVRFIAPYFCEVYSELLYASVKARDSASVASLNSIPLLIDSSQIARSAERTEQYLFILLKELHLVILLIEQQDYHDPESNLKKYYEPSLLLTLNELPASFIGFRNKYALELINLYVISFNNLKKPTLAEAIITGASKLRVDPHERSLLQERMEEIKRLIPAEKNKESNGVWRTVKIAFVILYVLIMIIRATSNSNTDKSDIAAPTESEHPFNGIIGSFPANHKIASAVELYTSSNTFSNTSGGSFSRSETGSLHYHSERNNDFQYQPVKLVLFRNKSTKDAIVFCGHQRFYIQDQDSILAYFQNNAAVSELILYLGKEFNQNKCFRLVDTVDIKEYCGIFEPIEESTILKGVNYRIYHSTMLTEKNKKAFPLITIDSNGIDQSFVTIPIPLHENLGQVKKVTITQVQEN